MIGWLTGAASPGFMTMRKPGSARRPRNPVARAVRTPLYRPRAEADKRKKVLEKRSRRAVRDEGGSDE